MSQSSTLTWPKCKSNSRVDYGFVWFVSSTLCHSLGCNNLWCWQWWYTIVHKHVKFV